MTAQTFALPTKYFRSCLIIFEISAGGASQLVVSEVSGSDLSAGAAAVPSVTGGKVPHPPSQAGGSPKNTEKEQSK